MAQTIPTPESSLGKPLRATAGSLESNDIFIALAPGEPGGNEITLESIVMKQFGPAILRVIEESLAEHDLTGVTVTAQDKGALDCTIRARMEAAIRRYKEARS